MTELYAWLAAAVLFAGTWLAALVLAMLGASRAVLAKSLEDRGRPEAARWLHAHYYTAVFTISLLRTISRVGFMVLVLAAVVDLSAEARLTWTDLAVTGAIAVPLLWVFTTVLASALARHAGAWHVATGLPFIRVVSWACWPLIKAVSFIDEVVRRLSGAKPRESVVSEADLLRSIEVTHREGGLDEAAASMLENVVEFSNTDVAEIMTPRTDIEGLELTDDLAAIRSFIVRSGHSRIPVYRGSVDRVVGILYVKDLVPFLGEGADGFRLEPLLRQPIFVPETKPVRELLSDFRTGEVHMAIVIDEYGGTEGLVTIEDVLEEIVGEIRDEHEPEGEEEPSLVPIDDRSAEVDGRFHIDDLNERLGLTLPESDDYDTIGGFMLARLGHVPDEGETFEAHEARFTAVATAPTHVQRVRVELLKAPASNGEPAPG